MPLIDRFYDWLAAGPAPDCERILSAALEHAEPSWKDRLVRILLQREHNAGWAGLIGQYLDLPQTIRGSLRANEALFLEGIGLALRSAKPAVRENALRALEECASARMAYVFPEALRDPRSKLRELAARILRKTADELLARSVPDAREDPEGYARYAAERREVVAALEQLLHSFDLHFRIEVLELCLWFARDLGDKLWAKLTSHRSRAGRVVSDHFYEWNHPRLAGFLLDALARPGWRAPVNQVLRNWTTPDEVTALLRETSYLDEPENAARVSGISRPRWFESLDVDLSEIPEDLRRHAPRWIQHVSYAKKQRIAVLSRWLQARDESLRRGAVYALARADTPDANRQLESATGGDDCVACFARWCLGFPTVAARSNAAPSAAPPPPSLDDPVPLDGDEVRGDFDVVWRVLRRAPAPRRKELIALLGLISQADDAGLLQRLHSSDPVERLLALEIASNPALAGGLRDELTLRVADENTSVQRLARLLLEALDARDDAAEGADDVPRPSPARRAPSELSDTRDWFERTAAESDVALDRSCTDELFRRVEQVYLREARQVAGGAPA